jgi:hypothetical protein
MEGPMGSAPDMGHIKKTFQEMGSAPDMGHLPVNVLFILGLLEENVPCPGLTPLFSYAKFMSHVRG